MLSSVTGTDTSVLSDDGADTVVTGSSAVVNTAWPAATRPAPPAAKPTTLASTTVPR